MQPRKIDLRDQKRIVEHLRNYLVRYAGTEWPDVESVKNDEGVDVFLQMFGRLTELLHRRLNRIPDRYFLAFMDMLGMDLKPQKAARTPLVFYPSSNAVTHIPVATGTRIAVEGDDKDPIIFETVEPLTVVNASLTRVTSVDPVSRRYYHHTDLLDPESRVSSTLFSGKKLIDHRFYLGHGSLLSHKNLSQLTLHVQLEQDLPADYTIPDNWRVEWYAYKEGEEEPVLLYSCDPNDPNDTNDPEVAHLIKSGSFTFTLPGNLQSRALSGYGRQDPVTRTWPLLAPENYWLFASLALPPGDKVPRLASITMELNLAVEDPAKPDRAYTNTRKVDLSRDFLPFGDRPVFNDTFYIASDDAFSRSGSTVEIRIQLSAGLDEPDPQEVEISYEYWSGQEWELLGRSSSTGSSFPEENGPLSFTDETGAFTSKGSGSTPVVTFQCPEMKKSKVNGKEHYWIRARITKGEFSKQVPEVIYSTVENGVTTDYTVTTTRYVPPSVESFTVSYSLAAIDTPRQYVRQTAGFLEDVTETFLLNEGGGTIQYVDLFEYGEDAQPSLYLGFNREVKNQSLSFYFSLLISSLTSVEESIEDSQPNLLWEGWTGSSWAPLSVVDRTETLTKKEIVQVLVPDAIQRRPILGENLYWIRIRMERAYNLKPESDGIYLNAVWVENRVAVEEELLGSSNGKPSQSFQISRTPVLTGQSLYVVEAGISDAERETILALEGEDAVREIYDEAGNLREIRVRWHEVNRLDFSGPRDRHYTIDRQTGMVYFGDGLRGIIPPAGRNNILMGQYYYGGGSRGNVARGVITQLRTSVPFVERVVNPSAVDGGVDQEKLDSLRLRGPSSIKTRNRSVTVEDFEAIVRESTSEIARVKCLPTTNQLYNFQQGHVTIIIVPDREEENPLPSQDLINYVRSYLDERASAYLTHSYTTRIHIRGPGYIKVGTTVKVKYKNLSDAKVVEERIRTALEIFFHPLQGGPFGGGWEFGRNVHISEVYAIIEDVEGVDYVEDVTVQASEQNYILSSNSSFTPYYSYPRESRLVLQGSRSLAGGNLNVEMGFLLLKEIRENVETNQMTVLGLKEGDLVSLQNGSDSDSLVIKSINQDIIEFEPRTLDFSYVPGDRLVSNDGNLYSTLLESAGAGSVIYAIRVALPDANDRYELIHKYSDSNRQQGWISGRSDKLDEVYLGPNFLTYSGQHVILAV